MNYGQRIRNHDKYRMKEMEKDFILPYIDSDEINDIQLDLIHYAFRNFPELEEKYGKIIREKKITWTGI